MQKIETTTSSPNITNAVLAAVHSPEREIDVQKLCDAVLDVSPKFWDNPNGAYETTCPFCDATDYRGGGGNIMASMSELDHEPNCAYLIAKDLSTNYR